MFIAFLGCDGSGKSAVISHVTECLQADGISVCLGHWQPRVLRGEELPDKEVVADDPHGQRPRGILASMLKLGWMWMNWWGGWWRWLRRRSHEGMVLHDRYHADLLVDPKRYRYGGPMWAAKLASHLMPQPNVVFFLDAEPEVLLSRKQEVSQEALIQSRNAYLKLVKTHKRFIIIDASKPLDEVVETVFKKIQANPRKPLPDKINH